MMTYNQENYIRQAIDSALAQQTTFEYEILIGDDCSTDSTSDIVREYAARHPSKIRAFLNRSNIGAMANFQQLLGQVRGAFLNILEGDDYWTCAQKLQKQVHLLDAHADCAICFHNALRVFEGEDRVPLPYNSADQKAVSTVEDLWSYDFIATCTAMFRYDCVRALPKWYFDLPHGADWALWILCAQHGNIRYLDETMAVYRIHAKGLWNQLDNVSKCESVIALHERMNANLGYRYNDIVQPIISTWQHRLALAQRTKELLAAHLPHSAIVVVVCRADEQLPKLPTSNVWPFPTRGRRDTRQLLARGARGSVEVPWIGAKGIYKFELYKEHEGKRLLASVAVCQGEAPALAADPRTELSDDRAYLTAEPNPVPKAAGPGKTMIRWNTGDGSPGRVEVTVEGQPLYYPRDSAEAIQEFDQLKRKGAEFLFVPTDAISLLKRYPELLEHIEGQHRVIASDDEAGSLYRLQ